MYEIRFHARAGQGAKSAAQFLAEAASARGKYVQAFPSFGPERRGATMEAFIRIDEEPIRIHSGVKNPDAVVVIEASLLDFVDVTEGLSDKGVLLVNSPESADKIKRDLGFNGQVYSVNASKIALDVLKRDIPNTVLLGALARITNVVDLKDLLWVVEKKFSRKLGPELTKANLEAVKRGFEAVKIK